MVNFIITIIIYLLSTFTNLCAQKIKTELLITNIQVIDSSNKLFYSYPLCNGLRKVQLKSNGKFGYATADGKLVIQPVYEAASDFTGDITGVTLNGKAGYIDKKGQTALSFKYEEASSFYNNRSVVKINGRLGAINKQGKLVVPAIYDYLLGFDSRGTSVAGKRVGTGIENDTPMKMGFVNVNNCTTIPFIFDVLDGFNQDFAYFEKGFDTEGTTGISDNHVTWKRGVVDRKGKQYFVAITQNSNAKIYYDEAGTKLIEVININIPVNGLSTSKNEQGNPVIKIQYGKAIGWTRIDNIIDDNNSIKGLKLLRDDWRKKISEMSIDEQMELHK